MYSPHAWGDSILGYYLGFFTFRVSFMEDRDIKKIALAVAQEVSKILYRRHRDEISLVDICAEYGISRQTIKRRVAVGVLPKPKKKGNKNYFTRSDVELADLKGLL